MARKSRRSSGNKQSARKKRSKSEISVPLPSVDRRAMETVMRRLVVELTGEHGDDTPLARAQEVLEPAALHDEADSRSSFMGAG